MTHTRLAFALVIAASLCGCGGAPPRGSAPESGAAADNAATPAGTTASNEATPASPAAHANTPGAGAPSGPATVAQVVTEVARVVARTLPAGARAAVYPPKVDGVLTDLSHQLATELETEAALAAKDRATIITRSLLEGVLKEQGLQMDDLTDRDTAVQVGQLLGADHFVSGTVTRLSGTRYRWTVQVIVLARGSILGGTRREFTTGARAGGRPSTSATAHPGARPPYVRPKGPLAHVRLAPAFEVTLPFRALAVEVGDFYGDGKPVLAFGIGRGARFEQVALGTVARGKYEALTQFATPDGIRLFAAAGRYDGGIVLFVQRKLNSSHRQVVRYRWTGTSFTDDGWRGDSTRADMPLVVHYDAQKRPRLLVAPSLYTGPAWVEYRETAKSDTLQDVRAFGSSGYTGRAGGSTPAWRPTVRFAHTVSIRSPLAFGSFGDAQPAVVSARVSGSQLTLELIRPDGSSAGSAQLLDLGQASTTSGLYLDACAYDIDADGRHEVAILVQDPRRGKPATLLLVEHTDRGLAVTQKFEGLPGKPRPNLRVADLDGDRTPELFWLIERENADTGLPESVLVAYHAR